MGPKNHLFCNFIITIKKIMKITITSFISKFRSLIKISCAIRKEFAQHLNTETVLALIETLQKPIFSSK